MLKLRPYQEDLISNSRQLMKQGVRSLIIESPCGSGKTCLTAKMLQTASEKGMSSLFIVHRRELVKQSMDTFKLAGVPHGVIAAGFYEEKKHLVQIASIQTLARRVKWLKKPSLIIWDECISGDSIIETNVGQIRMDSIPSYKDLRIKSFNGTDIVYPKIKAFKDSGFKEIYEITLEDRKKIKCTENHPLMTKEGWVVAGKLKNGEKVFVSPQNKNVFYTALLLAMVQLDTQIKDQKPLGWRGLIQPINWNGWSLRPIYYETSESELTTSEMQALEIILSEVEPLALKVLKKYIPQCIGMGEKLSAKNGFRVSALKELHGGCVMTDVIKDVADGLNLILKDTITKKIFSFKNSFLKDMEIVDCINIKEGIIQFDSQKNLQEILSKMLESMCQNVWRTSWVRIESIKKVCSEKVYDISVGRTHCFFSNGILVHNCHHVAAKSWSKIHDQYPDAYHIGLSATPSRLDGTGLGKWFKAIVHGPTVEWLINEGYLSKYKLYAPSSVNVSGVHTQMGDYNRKELNVATDKPSITGNAIHHYIKYAYGKRAIVFAVSIEHSKHIVADFQKAGISAVHVDGETPTEERDYAINKFREGSINVLSNVELFGEGFDLPAIEVAILLRPTKSLGCYVQQAGRVLRTLDGKREAIILDHAGNCQLHGLPDDERTWSLEGSRKKAQEKPEISVKICPSCFGAQKSYVKACIYCGYIFAVKSREVEHKEGDLVEVNSEIVRQTRTNDLWQAKTRDQLIELGRQRKYRHPEYWAHHILQARQLRKIKGKPVEVSNGNL